MGLKNKAVLAVGLVVFFACVAMGIIGCNLAAENFEKAFGVFAVATVAIVIISVVATNFIIGKKIDMLCEIINSMQKISKGDLRIEDLQIRSEDEIGLLAQGINEMQKELQNLIKNVSQNADKVSSSSHELTEVTQQATETVSFMSQNTAAMGEDAAVLAFMVNELEETIRDMRTKMHVLHESSNAMDEVAKGSAANAAIGKEKSDFAIDVMKTVSQGVQDSARMVGELGKRSDEIGQIVGTISSIAEQTNLLALNAAIEAARAGEHGRGFAVVSDEVRKLAEQSGEAASNIAELIHSIQEDTNSAVASIEKGAEGVKAGMESVLATGEAFKGIEEQAEKLAVTVKSSREYIEAVNTSSHTILDSVENVHEITSKTEEVSNSVTESATKQSETISKISDECQELSQLANDMRDKVTKFKI